MARHTWLDLRVNLCRTIILLKVRRKTPEKFFKLFGIQLTTSTYWISSLEEIFDYAVPAAWRDCGLQQFWLAGLMLEQILMSGSQPP
jgi:hypothetical protein